MAVVRDIPQFLEKSPKLVAFLEKLRNNGKKTFLLSNSSLPFMYVLRRSRIYSRTMLTWISAYIVTKVCDT